MVQAVIESIDLILMKGSRYPAGSMGERLETWILEKEILLGIGSSRFSSRCALVDRLP